jgi:hypothetical protein
MATRKTLRRANGYVGDLVGGINIPNIGFQQYSAQSDFYSTLDKKLDAITKFSTVQAGEEALTRADEFSVKNPINLNDFLNASKIEKQELVGDDNYTEYGKRVRLNQKNNILTQLTLTATKDFQNLRLEAEKSDMDPEEFANVIDARVNGYADLGFSIDSELGTKIKQSVGATANTMYVKYSDKKILEIKTQRLAIVSQHGADALNGIADIVASSTTQYLEDSDLTELPDGTQGGTGFIQYNPDQMLEAKKEEIVNFYLNNGKTPSEIEDFMAAWDARVLEEKTNYIIEEGVNTYENRNNLLKANETYYNFVDGNITNEKVRALYDSLSEKEKENVLKDVKTWRDLIVGKNEAQEEADQANRSVNIRASTKRLLIAERNNDEDEVQRELNYLLKIGAFTEYDSFNDGFEKDRGEGKYLIQATYDYLLMLDETGELSYNEINKYYNLNHISIAQKKDLISTMESGTNTIKADARRLMKSAVGYPTDEVRPIGNEYEAARIRYTNLEKDFNLFLYNNPRATEKEIYDKAVELSSKKLTSLLNTAEADNAKRAITTPQNGIKNRSWEKYFKDNIEGYTDLENQLKTKDGIETLKSTLLEAKNIPDKGTIERDTILPFDKVVIFRPLKTSLADIDAIIANLTAYSSFLDEPITEGKIQ